MLLCTYFYFILFLFLSCVSYMSLWLGYRGQRQSHAMTLINGLYCIVDSVCFANPYPLESDLFSGRSYSPFEQPRPERFLPRVHVETLHRNERVSWQTLVSHFFLLNLSNRIKVLCHRRLQRF